MVLSMLMVIMVTTYRFLHAGQRYTRETESYAAAQQQASSVIRALSMELGQSVSRYTKYGPGYVIFLSCRPPEGAVGPDFEFDPNSGQLIWKKWVCYYHEAPQETVLRAEIPLDTPTSDLSTEPTPVSIDPVPFQPTSITKRTVGRGISNFEITGATGRAYEFEVTSVFIAAVAAQSDFYKRVEVTLNSRVTMLNEG